MNHGWFKLIIQIIIADISCCLASEIIRSYRSIDRSHQIHGQSIVPCLDDIYLIRYSPVTWTFLISDTLSCAASQVTGWPTHQES